jgi:hypothetical protein
MARAAAPLLAALLLLAPLAVAAARPWAPAGAGARGAALRRAARGLLFRLSVGGATLTDVDDPFLADSPFPPGAPAPAPPSSARLLQHGPAPPPGAGIPRCYFAPAGHDLAPRCFMSPFWPLTFLPAAAPAGGAERCVRARMGS